MSPLQPSETCVTGGWVREGTRVIADENLLRIQWLVGNCLEKVALGNWSILYRDKSDGRFWEQFYPHGEMHAGGPESLRLLTLAEVKEKYPNASTEGATT